MPKPKSVLTWLSLLSALAACSVVEANGGDADEASCSDAVGWRRASGLEGEVGSVRGPVVSTRYVPSEKGRPTFLNIGVDYPNPSRFTVVIFGEDRGSFAEAPEDAYDGARVCVTGLVEDYQGVTEMVLDDEDDLVVLP